MKDTIKEAISALKNSGIDIKSIESIKIRYEKIFPNKAFPVVEIKMFSPVIK